MSPATPFCYGLDRVGRCPPSFFGGLEAVAQVQLLSGVDDKFAAYFLVGLGEQ